MTYTYNLASADATIVLISQVRLEIGDEVEHSGVKPSGDNLSDEELTVLLTREESHVMRTVAAACELLARQWSRIANISVGPRSESLGKVASDWGSRAAELRQAYGGGTSGIISAGVLRVDGYSDDVPSDAVDATSEWTPT